LQQSLDEETALHKRVLTVHSSMREQFERWDQGIQEAIETAGPVTRGALQPLVPTQDLSAAVADPHHATYCTVTRAAASPTGSIVSHSFKQDTAHAFTSRAGGWVGSATTPRGQRSSGSPTVHSPVSGPLYSPRGSPPVLYPGPCSPAGKETLANRTPQSLGRLRPPSYERSSPGGAYAR